MPLSLRYCMNPSNSQSSLSPVYISMVSYFTITQYSIFRTFKDINDVSHVRHNYSRTYTKACCSLIFAEAQVTEMNVPIARKSELLHANNKAADQTALQRSLISAFVFRSLKTKKVKLMRHVKFHYSS